MSRLARKPTLRTSLSMPHNPNRHFLPSVNVLFQESLLYTSIQLRRNVSARISLRGLRRLIWVNTLRRGHNVGFLAGTVLYMVNRVSCLPAEYYQNQRNLTKSLLISSCK